MSLSVYIHVPYCIQRCRYCDFTTFEQSQIMPPEDYIRLVIKEIRQRHAGVPSKDISTIFFGGGTPSLLEPKHILAILDELNNVGFRFSTLKEITIEINPATIDQQKLDAYVQMGINRFSVGAQSFNDELLKLCGRRHSADDTRHTLRLLLERNLKFSFDLLFALPNQNLGDLEKDLDEALKFQTKHMSLYCLTVPEGHPMSFGRAPEGEQLEMFDLIDKRLVQAGLVKYEVSNYAQPGYESLHNLTYWNDRAYWGIGLSAHSYFVSPEWGVRFWNPKSFDVYAKQLEASTLLPYQSLPLEQKEFLNANESLSDYCHMAFRQPQGLQKDAAQNKYGDLFRVDATGRLGLLKQRGWAQETPTHWILTIEGERLLNQVLLELSF